MSRSSVSRAADVRIQTPNWRRFDSPERGIIEFCVISISFLSKQQSNPRGGPPRVNGGEAVRERDPEAHNPSEGCRWKTAVKNNRRREALLNQPQKSLIPPEGDGAPCNPSSWEEESKTGSALWRETWCKTQETPRGTEPPWF